MKTIEINCKEIKISEATQRVLNMLLNAPVIKKSDLAKGTGRQTGYNFCPLTLFDCGIAMDTKPSKEYERFSTKSVLKFFSENPRVKEVVYVANQRRFNKVMKKLTFTKVMKKLTQ